METQNPQQPDDIDLTPQIKALTIEIHESGETFMANIEEFIELTGGDLKLAIEDIKRVGNFLHEVIEAHPITYTLSEIMTLLELDEPTVRRLFNGVGLDFDPAVQNPEEVVTEKDVIALLADRAGSREGKLLADFLRGGGPEIIWG